MAVAVFSMDLFGPFRLARGSARIAVTSRRSQALLAMLAASGNGERTRGWLQDRLWGSRGPEQAQASLRRELSNLRKLLNRDGAVLIDSDHQRVWLDLALIAVDLRRPGPLPRDEFLEGIDLPGEEGFEDWLREERRRHERPDAPAAPVAPVLAEAADGGALTSLALPSDDTAAERMLTDRLARLRWLAVLSNAGPQTARYTLALSGDLDADSPQQLGLRLTDAATARVLWSGQVRRPEPDCPGVDLIDMAVAELRARIAQAEQVRATSPGADLAAPASRLWASQWHMHRLNRTDAREAAALAEAALAQAPHGREALIQATWVRIWDLWVSRATGDDVRAARAMAQQVIVADHEDARGHMLAGIAEIWLRQPLRAEVLLRRALELDPSLIMARMQLSCALYNKLEVAESEQQLRIAAQLSPNDQYRFFLAGELATVCLMQGRNEEALVHAETALAGRRSYLHGHVAKTNALVRLSRMAEARAALDELYRVNPAYSPAFIDWIPFLDSRWNDFFKDGLNRAAAWSD